MLLQIVIVGLNKCKQHGGGNHRGERGEISSVDLFYF